MELGSNIKSLRLSMGKTQDEIAKSAGFEQSLYAKWEADKSLPGAENLVKLANVFNCSVDYLLGREREDGIIVVNGQQQESIIPKELENIYIKLDSMHRNILIGIARNVLEAQKQRA